MNSFRNSNFLRRVTTKEGGEKSGKVLFSGFLIAFLGTTGMQTEMSLNLLPTEDVKEVVQEIPLCSDGSTLASLEIANDYSPQIEDKPKESEECLVYKNIESTLKEKTKVPSATSEEIPAVKDLREREQEKYEKRVAELESMLKGYPLAKMAPEIAKQKPEIAALIVGIARKESQWGVRSPKKNGDCFNYWGYKGGGGRGVGMGYACFATREEAVGKIALKLEKLVNKRGTSKPSALVTTWKCGSSCATHSPESVSKWVSDVNQYYSKVLAMK